jgi:hypothetical protein
MSEIFIVLILLIPIAIGAILVNSSHKKQKKKKQEAYLKNLEQVKAETGFHPTYTKHLHTQLIALDEVNRKLLVIDNKNDVYSHTLFDLTDLKSYDLKHVKETVLLEGGKKSETFTSLMGLDIVPAANGERSKLIVFYDHHEHNIMSIQVIEKEALQLKERIRGLINNPVTI